MPIITWRLVPLVCALSAVQKPPPAMMTGETTSQGSVTVAPTTGISGQYGTWTVTYTVGPAGIEAGGGIRVQLPDAWHSGPRNSANRLQATDPKDDHYVTATSSRSAVPLETIVESQTSRTLVKHAKKSLDGRSERYVFVVRVRLTKGRLEPGDTISVVYGDRSEGSRGMLAAAVSGGPWPILLAVDENGADQFKLHTDRPTLTALPGKAVEMLFHAPSLAAKGKPIRLLVVLLDKQSNPIAHGATIQISTVTGSANVPHAVNVPPGKGFVELQATPTATGILRFHAEVESLNLSADANPVDVTAVLPEREILWGDLHSHTHFSWDGVGDEPFTYARYVSGLDFYAMTDHSMTPRNKLLRGLCEQYWPEYTALTDKHHDPPRFITLHAYECSFGRPYGHHNVFFRNRPGVLLSPSETTLPKLWAALRAGDALTIPHHTGKFPSGIKFSPQDPERRRNFEIYSGHGLSEAYAPAHPLAFEHSLFTSDSKSLNQPSYAQNVWMAGLKLSTIASSDDHRAQPGQPHYGLVAVRAAHRTRDGVFQALYERRTYATTGAKIILDMSLNGIPMGQTATVDGSPTIDLRAIGTDDIEWVELLRHQPEEDSFQVVKKWQPNQSRFTGAFTDRDFKPGAVYYVRLRQKNIVRDRVVMAWSSPIWTRPTK